MKRKLPPRAEGGLTTYEELIKRLRWTAANDEQVFDAETATLAADAIEQLQSRLAQITAERDAAVEDLQKAIGDEGDGCDFCAYNMEGSCEALEKYNICQWMWRGLRKEDTQ